ncbi:MAG TPA: branched-chain amino acid ABC transporter permease [Mycobacteriales bacterium]|nr:branched-chain amino acid ABC transporter permease [Mycobacteriales bacterium]
MSRRVPMLLRHGIPAVLGLGILLAVTEGLPAYRNTQLANIATEVCAVAGLTILTGLSGQISLGNGAFMFVGAYTVGLLLKHHPITHNGELVLVLLAAVLVAAIVGALVGVAAARLRGPYLAGITLALAVGLPSLPLYSHLQGPLGGHSGFSVDAPPPPNGMDYFRWQAWICVIAAVITLFLLANLSSSRVGRAFRAVRDDEIAASLAGIAVARVQILAFVISAACAGLAGGLFAIVAGSVGPNSFSLTISLGLLAAAVFGGLGTLSGAVYGSIIVTLLPSWSQDIASHVSLSDQVANNLPQAVYGVGLIVGMLLFPLGIQGLVHRVAALARNTLRTKPAGN